MPAAAPLKISPQKKAPAPSLAQLAYLTSQKDTAEKLIDVSGPPSQLLILPDVKDETKPLSKTDVAATAARDRMVEILGQFHCHRSSW